MRKLHRATAILLLLGGLACAQTERHGRKYVPPAPAAHIQVTVTKAANGKPVPNAAVIFHPLKGGKDEGNMEIKTNHEGVAELDLIPVGDTVRLQVVAEGFQTFGQDYTVDSDTKNIDVKLLQPGKQSSLYPSSDGNASPSSTTK
jgi:Carboxypeptidase regulatory-like domain